VVAVVVPLPLLDEVSDVRSLSCIICICMKVGSGVEDGAAPTPPVIDRRRERGVIAMGAVVLATAAPLPPGFSKGGMSESSVRSTTPRRARKEAADIWFVHARRAAR
jgi:hypothetical protein